MIPAGFDYVRASDLKHAVDLLAGTGDAQLLAGGHSLLPQLKLRQTSASLLIDLSPLRDQLAGIRREDGTIVVGALTRYIDLERSQLVATRLPLLADAAGQVGDTQVRRRGTIGGSLANAARAADLPAVALALDAQALIEGPEGSRVLPIDELIVADQQTALRAGEILVEIRFPDRDTQGWSYQRFTRRTQDWPTVAVSCVRSDGGTAVSLANVADRPIRARALEEALGEGKEADSHVVELLHDVLDPPDDARASAAYRRHLASVLTSRALAAAS